MCEREPARAQLSVSGGGEGRKSTLGMWLASIRVPRVLDEFPLTERPRKVEREEYAQINHK